MTRLIRRIIRRFRGKTNVQKFMTQSYNEFMKGRSAYDSQVLILAGRDLYETFEDGLVMLTRYVAREVKADVPKLVYKSARMYKLAQPGYKMIIIQGDRAEVFEL